MDKNKNAFIQPTTESSASLEQPCRILINCLPVRLSNITDMGLHRNLWGGLIHARDSTKITSSILPGIH